MKLIGIPGKSADGQTSVSMKRIDEYRANNLILTVTEKNTIESIIEKSTKQVNLESKEKVEPIIGKYMRCHQGAYTGKIARVSSTYHRKYSVIILGEYGHTTYSLATGKLNFFVSMSDVFCMRIIVRETFLSLVTPICLDLCVYVCYKKYIF